VILKEHMMNNKQFIKEDGTYDFVRYKGLIEESRRQDNYKKIAKLADHLFPRESTTDCPRR